MLYILCNVENNCENKKILLGLPMYGRVATSPASLRVKKAKGEGWRIGAT